MSLVAEAHIGPSYGLVALGPRSLALAMPVRELHENGMHAVLDRVPDGGPCDMTIDAGGYFGRAVPVGMGSGGATSGPAPWRSASWSTVIGLIGGRTL